MAHVRTHADDITLESPTLIEGLPGVGLVGKIAADHFIDAFDMTYYADVVCDGLPKLAIYEADDPMLRPPVRLYADEERQLVVLQSDVPVSPKNASDFASCLVGWLAEQDILPIFLSGLPSERDESPPELFGTSTGTGNDHLSDAGLNTPPENGVIAGPTGALLHQAQEQNLSSVGLVVESSPQFPDPEAAHILIRNGITPMTGIDVGTDELIDRAEEIRKQREQLAKQMHQADEESSRAEPLRMYQ
ncbi:MAG: proteasome assembly chaperone family protein [Halobacteriales archaeon]